MQLADAEKLALELMAQFGLSHWRFEWSDAKREFGSCQHSRFNLLGTAPKGGTVRLSRVLVGLNERPKVEDTIRHEIAHALCDPKEGHGAKWKAACKVTGAKPKRCYTDEEAVTPKGDWIATCPECGRVTTKFREPKRDTWCGSEECRHRFRPYGTSRFDPLTKLVYRHRRALEATKPPQSVIDAMKAHLKKQSEGK